MIEENNSEGYTFIKFLILLAAISLSLIILIPKVSKSKKEETKKTTKKEDSIITATKDYIKSNSEYFSEFFKEKDMIYRVDIDELQKNNLYDNKENKTGYINVIDNKYFNFINTENGEYLIKKIIDSNNGVNNETSPFDLKYIYIGNDVNNYLKYNEKMYRIIGVTNSNHLKLIELDENNNLNSFGLGSDINWFIKKEGNNFSNELGYNSDKGIFYVGFVRSNVTPKEEIIKNEKRNNEYTIKQPKYYGKYASFNISDLINSSTDCKYNLITEINKENCNSYLFDVVNNSYSITTGEDNKIYYISDNKIELTNKLDNIKVHNVIYVNGLELYTGIGTFDDPYILN